MKLILKKLPLRSFPARLALIIISIIILTVTYNCGIYSSETAGVITFYEIHSNKLIAEKVINKLINEDKDIAKVDFYHEHVDTTVWKGVHISLIDSNNDVYILRFIFYFSGPEEHWIDSTNCYIGLKSVKDIEVLTPKKFQGLTVEKQNYYLEIFETQFISKLRYKLMNQ
ncbi:MAG: hypothetical protein IIA45_09765 [Bacteroidetes bacterium]|nr:hypothetical protein [Bacteroidota bacterium]